MRMCQQKAHPLFFMSILQPASEQAIISWGYDTDMRQIFRERKVVISIYQIKILRVIFLRAFMGETGKVGT